MTQLYAHQRESINFLVKRSGALLTLDMGLGKTRCSLVAAQQLYAERKIDRVLVLAPAAVRISWREEFTKLEAESLQFLQCVYKPKEQAIVATRTTASNTILPVLTISYALLPQKRHVEALSKWAASGKTLLVCDESSFLKSRTAKQTKGSAQIAKYCLYRWLLTGTPIANSPLDLYGQALVMANGAGPLKQFKNFYHFRSRYAQLVTQHMGRKSFQTVVGYQNLDELTEKFKPYVLRRTKQECLDLPAKSYTVREIQLSEATWRIYQELRRDALLALPDEDVRPEPNAAVRILRLCQLTSGHVSYCQVDPDEATGNVSDVSSEKLDWLAEQILKGELSNEQALIVWCRWVRERIRLQQLLATKIEVYGVFGGQQEKNRSYNVQSFQTSTKRRVLVAQQHSGGYGLNLTAASTAVYLSNDFSFTARIQSEDRTHRLLQTNPCLYIDVVAVGPRGQKTVDAHVLECLRNKKSISDMTCSAWKRALDE